MATTRTVGARAESQAAAFLADQGLRIVERNFSCRLGEIDIVALDQQCLVFVEVRTRRQSGFGSAALSVDHHKQRKILRTALVFLRCFPRYAQSACRFDVIGIDSKPADESGLLWIRDAFRPL